MICNAASSAILGISEFSLNMNTEDTLLAAVVVIDNLPRVHIVRHSCIIEKLVPHVLQLMANDCNKLTI